MAYCRNCGALLKDDDIFCFKCGQSIDKQANEDSEMEFSNDGSATAPVSKEESIALAEKLKTEYGAVERLQKEITENETSLKKPLTFSGRRYSAFRFFWPFFIFAYLALNGVFLVGVIASSGSDDGTGITITVLLAFASAIGLLIFGGVRAGRKRDALNEELIEQENHMRQRRREIENKTVELKTKLKNKKQELSEYQSLVPIKFRTKHYMEKVVILLQSDRAENFQDALKALNN